jgi:predicted unusual protein kinase regulating ubiquinone biosynthesis (AarF/ABC1/UbiB family)
VASNDIFHADVHAGNLLVLEDGTIGFIDFGIGTFLFFYFLFIFFILYININILYIF